MRGQVVEMANMQQAITLRSPDIMIAVPAALDSDDCDQILV